MDVGIFALWTATVIQTLFVVLYATRAWWRHFVGRALFVHSAALMVTLQASVVNHYLVYRYQLQVSVLLLWVMAAAFAYQTGALIKQMRLDRHTRQL